MATQYRCVKASFQKIVHRAEDHIEKPRYLLVEFLSQKVDQIGPAWLLGLPFFLLPAQNVRPLQAFAADLARPSAQYGKGKRATSWRTRILIACRFASSVPSRTA